MLATYCYRPVADKVGPVGCRLGAKTSLLPSCLMRPRLSRRPFLRTSTTFSPQVGQADLTICNWLQYGALLPQAPTSRLKPADPLVGMAALVHLSMPCPISHHALEHPVTALDVSGQTPGQLDCCHL